MYTTCMTTQMITRPVTLKTYLREQHNANPTDHAPHDGCNGRTSGEMHYQDDRWRVFYYTFPTDHSRWDGTRSVPCECAADHYHH